MCLYNTRTYNLEYRSKYACPTNSVPTPTPTPTPTPPSKGDLCCLYVYYPNPSVTKTLCASACPSPFNGYMLASNWAVGGCSDCFFRHQ
jgi:hypothetical protein